MNFLAVLAAVVALVFVGMTYADQRASVQGGTDAARGRLSGPVYP